MTMGKFAGISPFPSTGCVTGKGSGHSTQMMLLVVWISPGVGLDDP